MALLPAALLTAGLAQAATPAVQTLPHSRAVTYLGNTPSWFICDSLDSPTISVMGWPNARGLSRLTTYSKALPGRYTYLNYRVGRADPGAGQINYGLTLSGAGSDQGYFIGSFNVGALSHPEQAITPNIVTLKSQEASGNCRWTLNTRLFGFDKRRSFMVSETPSGGLTYQTWNYDDAVRPQQPDGAQRTSLPSLSITGGRRFLSETQESFVFQNAGYTYTVRVARLGAPAGATVTVSRGGRVVQTEPLTGYTYAVRR